MERKEFTISGKRYCEKNIPELFGILEDMIVTDNLQLSFNREVTTLGEDIGVVDFIRLINLIEIKEMQNKAKNLEKNETRNFHTITYGNLRMNKDNVGNVIVNSIRKGGVRREYLEYDIPEIDGYDDIPEYVIKAATENVEMSLGYYL